MNYQTKVKKHFQERGYKVVKLIRLSENGYPDIMLMRNGRVSFIECKEASDTLKPLQKLRIDQLIADGFAACCMQAGRGIIYGKAVV